MAEPVLAPHTKLFWTASNLQKEVIYDKKGYLHAGPNTLALPRGLYGVDEILIMGLTKRNTASARSSRTSLCRWACQKP